MKNVDSWCNFTRSGKVDDYLSYIACTREDILDDSSSTSLRKEDGEYHAGISHRDGNGSIGHASWGL